ncbi:MAG: BamA/TamA family outer membrane protein, partial [Saprospiraceae bacterium]|nr:BamA/TamA family outer membrane protein [Saprospiraceae bacterium]
VLVLTDSTILTQPADSTFFAGLDSSLIDTVFTRKRYLTVGAVAISSNFGNRIHSMDLAPKVNQGVQVLMEEDELKVYEFQPQPGKMVDAWTTPFQRARLDRRGLLSALSGNLGTTPGKEPVKQSPPDQKVQGLEIEDGLLFQSEFSEPEVIAEIDQDVLEVEEDNTPIRLDLPVQSPPPVSNSQDLVIGKKFSPSRIIPYRLRFRTDLLTTTLDNSLLFGGLDNFAAEPMPTSIGGVPTVDPSQNENLGYQNQPLGILLKANVKDLFEDYEMEGGIRIPTRFNGAEYFVFFDDKKNRLDKRYAFYRKNLRLEDQLNPATRILERREATVNLAQYQLRYPLDIFRSVRGIATVREDKTTKLATDSLAFVIPTVRFQRAGLRLEYVFDNTLPVSPNILNGTRYKVYVEAVKKIQVDLIDEFKFSLNEGWLGLIGFDARHYQRIDKRSIIAARLAGASSFGREKILYYLGGVDNAMFTSFDSSIPFPTSGDFAYQTLATNMRGFKQNIRNGNSFAVANFELRVPFLNYFFKRLRSPFLKNLQAIGFFDLGTAWEGPTPFDEDSPINSATISEPNTPVVIQVNYFRDPIVAGYGAGLRTSLFGYFIRFDWAYGIETREVQDRMIHFSLGKDF